MELASGNQDSGEVALELRVIGDALTLTVTTRGAVQAPHRIDDERNWGMIDYLAKVISGHVNRVALPTGGSCRTVTIPLAALARGEGARPVAR